MFDAILHFLGICHDHTTHPNLLNLFGLIGFISGILFIVKQKIKNFFYYLKNKLK